MHPNFHKIMNETLKGEGRPVEETDFQKISMNLENQLCRLEESVRRIDSKLHALKNTAVPSKDDRVSGDHPIDFVSHINSRLLCFEALNDQLLSHSEKLSQLI